MTNAEGIAAEAHDLPDTACRWAEVRDGVDGVMDLVLEFAADEGAVRPRTRDDAAASRLTQHCPPDTDAPYTSVLEPLFRVAEEVPFAISRIIKWG